MEADNVYGFLLEMGFGPLRARKALIMTEDSGIDSAVNWLSEHENDPEPTEEEIHRLEAGRKEATCSGAKTEAPQQMQEEIEMEASKYQELLTKRREQRDKEEELEKIKAERERRRIGREMQSTRQKMKEEGMHRALEEKKRERLQDSEYLKQLKLQMEFERKERYGSSTEEEPKPAAEAAPEPVRKLDPDAYSKSRIQIIIPDSPRLLKVFPSTSTLSEVYDFVSQETGRIDFDLVPSVKISGYDPKLKEKSLDSLGLARGASLILTPWG